MTQASDSVGLPVSAALRRDEPSNPASSGLRSRGVEPSTIRETRRTLRISQEQLAREADCSTVYVRLVESGYSPTVSDVIPRIIAVLAQRLAEALGSSVNELFPNNTSGPTVTAAGPIKTAGGTSHGQEYIPR